MPSQAPPPAGRLSYAGPPELPGVHVMRVDRLSRQFYVHLDRYDITLLLNTESRTLYRRRAYEGRPFDLFLGEPGELITTNLRGLPESYRSLFIDAGEVEKLAQEAGGRAGLPRFTSVMRSDASVSRPFVRLHRLLESGASALEIQSAFVTAMGRVLERATSAAPPATSPTREEDAIRRAREVLDDRLAENVTLDELSREARLPRLRFFRAFVREVGVPPHEYQIQRRVSAARERLIRGEPVVEVAADLGFCDQSHLTRHFSRVMGLSPKAFARCFAPR